MVVGVSAGAALLIGAGVGVLAAIAGSAAGGFATYKIAERRQRFERTLALRVERRDSARELAIARGIARVWADQLEGYAAMLSSVLTTPTGPEWWPDEMHQRVTIQIEVEDRKLVAAAVTDDEWELMRPADNGVTIVESSRTFARQQLVGEPEAFGPELNELELEIVDQTLRQIDAAVGVLKRLSAKEPTVDLTDPDS